MFQFHFVDLFSKKYASCKMYTSCKAPALCHVSSAKVKSFHLTFLSKVVSSHSTLFRLLWTFYEGCFYSIAHCAFALSHCHMSNLSVRLCPLESTHLKNMGICCPIMHGTMSYHRHSASACVD